jgi:heptosyltransferase-1
VKALIVRLSAIGDVVHTLPALAALKRSGFEVGWVAEPRAGILLEEHPLVAHLTLARAAPFPVRPVLSAARSLRERRYDVALDFQGRWKSALWARLSGAPRVLGYLGPQRRDPLSALALTESVDLPSDLTHVIDRNLALLRPLGIEALGSRAFPMPPTSMQAASVDRALGELGLGPFVILNPGGGWVGKLWSPEGYGSVARALRDRGFASLVTWGPGEERLADRVVVASLGAAVRSFPATLLEYAELARRARLVVAADTGALHLGCAQGTPVVGIYGPTDPARNGPFSPRDVVVRRTPLCSPCSRRHCRIHEGVMQAIAPREVVRAIDQRLGISKGPSNLAV